MKTGTPPRLDGTTINYEELEMQDADEKPYFFSYLTKKLMPNRFPVGWLILMIRFIELLKKI